MRIGIFGGSFDPVHVGHLLIAESALEDLKLAEVRWLPAATSPLKREGAVASGEQRLQMVQLAIGGADGHRVDDRELRRGDISFTVDTLAELTEEMPDAELFLIIGSDSMASFRKWRSAERILELATPAVVQRGGEPAIDFSVLDGLAASQTIDAAKRSVIKMPVLEMSSSEIRERVAAGRSIRFRTPRAVEALIESQGLYREG